jgi:hypothetical protein
MWKWIKKLISNYKIKRFPRYFVYVEWEKKDGEDGNLQSIMGLSKNVSAKDIADNFIKEYGFTRVVIKSVQRM